MDFNIGNRLKELRNDMSMEKLVDEFNKLGFTVNKGMISKWENNRSKPNNSNLVAYAKYFNVSLNFLLGLTDDKNLKDDNFPLSSKELQKLEEKKLIKDISLILEKNSQCSLGEIKRGNKVDIIRNEEILKTYDVELILKAYEIKYLKDKFSLEDIEELDHRFNIPDDLKGVSRKQYIKFMGESAMFFDDDSVSEETKDKLLLSFQRMFYDAKEKNKRKK